MKANPRNGSWNTTLQLMRSHCRVQFLNDIHGGLESKQTAEQFASRHKGPAENIDEAEQKITAAKAEGSL
jgi:hypothetical protein